MGWALILILPALFLTNCLGAMLAFVVGFLYFARKEGYEFIIYSKSRIPLLKAALCIMLPVLLILAVSLHGWTDSHRISAWTVAFQAWWGGIGLPEGVRLKWTLFRNPIIGWGPGSFGLVFPPLYQPLTSAATDLGAWNKMHNEYLQILWEYGLVGVTILGAFLWRMWAMMMNHGTQLQMGIRAAVMAIAVNCLFFFPFQLTETSLLFLSLLAFVNGDWVRRQETANDNAKNVTSFLNKVRLSNGTETGGRIPHNAKGETYVQREGTD